METLLPNAVKDGETLADVKKRAKIDGVFAGQERAKIDGILLNRSRLKSGQKLGQIDGVFQLSYLSASHCATVI